LDSTGPSRARRDSNVQSARSRRSSGRRSAEAHTILEPVYPSLGIGVPPRVRYPWAWRISHSTYRPRDTEHSVLHAVIREHLEPFLREVLPAATATACPRFVEQEFREFLTCGVLAHGFTRLRCRDCTFERLVPFSCKRRGFYPSCGGRRMAERGPGRICPRAARLPRAHSPLTRHARRPDPDKGARATAAPAAGIPTLIVVAPLPLRISPGGADLLAPAQSGAFAHQAVHLANVWLLQAKTPG